jgi:alpha-tubulin suppressor-like RCC1 family protein
MGHNGYGQLGNGSAINQTTPIAVASNVVAAAAGGYHSLFVKSDGTLWTMGRNDDGQLGSGNYYSSRSVPTYVASNVVAVAGGNMHSLFMRNDGSLWGMGDNSSGELGNGTTGNTIAPMQLPGFMVASLGRMPVSSHSLCVGAIVPQISGLANAIVQAGQSFAFNPVVRGTGPFAYQWQLNGVNIPDATNLNYFVPNASPVNVGNYTLIVTGYMGANSASSLSALMTVQPMGGLAVSGASASLSATNSGGILNCQWFKDGAMLVGQTNSVLSFDSFQFTNGGGYSVVITTSYGIAISQPVFLSVSNAPLLTWGYNYYGQLGNGTRVTTNVPVTVASNVVAVAAGGNHSLFVASDGSLWAVGYNNYGQLGNGNTVNQSTPVVVASNVVGVAAGGSHSLFVKSDGTLWAMGNGFSSLPVNVASNVVAVAAGGSHSLFIKNDGSLWAMGGNQSGQLGIGQGDTYAHPVPTTVATNVVAVAAGGSHSLFVKADGTLWGMGYSNDGELGNGLRAYQYSPVMVASNVAAVAAGSSHSLFVKSDGTLWTMGNNGSGQLGNGTTANSLLPVNIASNVVTAAAGSSHSLFVKSDGTLWAMGDNGYGELGDWRIWSTNMPMQIAGLTIASLGTCSTASHTISVGLDFAPLQLSGPNNQFVTLGQPASFSITIRRGDGPFTYQWQFNGTNILNATNTGYNITNVALTDVGTYSVIVTGAAGIATNSAQLVVLPTVMVQPAGGVVYPGQTTNLSATAVGLGAFTYQWLKDGVLMANQTNSTLNFASFQFTNGGSYSVVVSNAYGSVISRPVMLSLPGAPLKAWGYNNYGQLGNGTTANSTLPLNIASNVVAVSGGGFSLSFCDVGRDLVGHG